MPVARMRMRPWLEQMIESNKIPGLNWIDKDKTMFTIPWKHAARHGWEMDKDACLFKEWAIHTGKYCKGQNCDPKTWKANFRCAMNSLPDIEEVKDQSINKGHLAKRVFRMLPVTPKSRDKRSKARETRKKMKSEDDSDYSDTHSPASKAMLGDLSSSEEGSVDLEVQDFPTFEIKAESNQNFNYRFEVSPVHSNDDEFEDIIEICKQLEKADQPSHAFPCLSYTSPEQAWSDSSSDTDNTPEYMMLGTDFSFLNSSVDSMWTSFLQSPI